MQLIPLIGIINAKNFGFVPCSMANTGDPSWYVIMDLGLQGNLGWFKNTYTELIGSFGLMLNPIDGKPTLIADRDFPDELKRRRATRFPDGGLIQPIDCTINPELVTALECSFASFDQ